MPDRRLLKLGYKQFIPWGCSKEPLIVSWKRLGVFLLPLDGMLVHRRSLPQQFAGTHLYSWVERGTVRVECLAQEHNTVSPARARTWTARSGNERLPLRLPQTDHKPKVTSLRTRVTSPHTEVNSLHARNWWNLLWIFLFWCWTCTDFELTVSSDYFILMQLPVAFAYAWWH